MIDKNTFTKEVNFHGTKGLVFVGNKIIVFRRDNKTDNLPLQVDLPGGGREGNESPFDTFRRETKEEFGIEIKETDVVYAKSRVSVIDPTKQAYFIVTKALDIKESDIVFGDEGLEFFLIKPEEFVALPDGVKRQQDRVAEYLNTLK